MVLIETESINTSIESNTICGAARKTLSSQHVHMENYVYIVYEIIVDIRRSIVLFHSATTRALSELLNILYCLLHVYCVYAREI